MLLLIGLCVLFRVLPVEGCSFNQQSLANLIPTEQGEFLPNSSLPLPMNATCQWNITAPVGWVLRIRVSAANFKGSCSDEHLTIYDGPNNLNRVITKYCNGVSTLGTYFFSSGSSLFLEAKTKFFSYAEMNVKYRMLNFEDCSRNTTLSAPESPTQSNFSSPYYPVGFPMNITCGWYITAPENHIVKVQVTSKLSGSPSSNDRVRVYDVDGSELGAISVDLDDHTDTGTVYSKFRRVYVLFKSDLKPQESLDFEQGMFVIYTAIKPATSCSSSNTQNQNKNIILKNTSGTINTPGYPTPYPTDLATQCIWKIIAPKEKMIRLDVLSFRMGDSFCLSIQNDVNMKNPFYIFKCGTWPSFTVYSSGRELGLNVLHRGITPGPGFIANYSFVPAGSSAGTCILENNTTVHISGEGRSFVTPGFPHPRIGTCSWNITVPPGKFVKLNFWTFRGLCDKNYAEVFDMTDSKSEALTGKFCDEKVVFSKGNNVFVRYSTKQGVRHGGFVASYEALGAVPATYSCSKKSRGYVYKLTGTAGAFASFDYPLTYPNDASCTWDLTVPPTHLVLITFHSFDLQQSQDCSADYVEIKRLKWQGLYYVWQVFRKLCGSSLPASYQSNYSSVRVEFMSDSSGRFPGFNASFSAVPNPAMGPCKLQGVDNVIPLTGTTGRLFSPLYPQTYPPNMTCTWMITVPEGHFVKLKLTSFRLESTCDGPILQIRDGRSESSDLLKSFCAREFESSVFSNGRHLWVRFRTPDDQFLRGDGFNAFFEAVTQLPAPFSCTDSKRIVKLTSDTGSLASYNYPLPYDNDIECIWVINVDTDYKIKLSFDFFNLSYSSDCSEDYVEVRDGKFCGSEKPESITSDIWGLRVVFKSSGKRKFPGFKAKYETKKSTAAILKIVGIVLGVLSALCTIIAAFCKCCKSHDGEPVVQGSQNNVPAEHAGPENLALEEQTTQT